MQLNKKLGALLIGASLACVPFLGKAQLNAGDTFVFGGATYIVVPQFTPENEFPDTPEDVREEAAEAYATTNLGGFSSPFLDVEELYAPFDAGISLLLGAGAIAGIKKARNRRKSVIA
jgi:hypothetical protein